MADNVNITPGSGNIVAADEVTDGALGTVKVQYVKLMDGTLDSTNKAVVDGSGNLQVNVNNFPASQAVTGTFFQATQPVSVASLPLPSGAATAANQTNGSQTTQVADNAGHSWNIDPSGTGRVNVVTSTALTVSGTVTANAGTNLNTSALALETGGNLAAINAKVPALGQALAAASVPVVLTAAQLTTLTPLSSVSVSNFPATQPVSGSVSVSNFPATQPVSGTVAATQSGTWTVQPGNTANTTAWKVDGSAVTQPISGTITATQATGTNLHVVVDSAPTTAITGTVTATQATGTNLHTVVDSGTITAVTAITNALPAGSNVIGHVIADTGSTTAVTGNVTVIQPTGTNLHAVLDSGTTTVTQATGTNLHTVVDSGSITVTQATAANLNATVTGTVAATQSGTWTVQPGNTANTTAWLVSQIPANLSVTATGAAAAAVTLTLPAVAGQFHYITFIEILAYSTVARTGSATPVLVTSTNLPGSNVWTFQSAAAIGTSERQLTNPNSPIKSSVVNTSTTIVGPATTSVIWRMNVYYYIAA